MVALLERPPKFKTPREEGEYLVWDDVPVWAEHRDPDGSGHVFDETAMRRVADRCNERIEETGDFTPIVIRHTKDSDGDTGDIDPPVVGLAGPYRVKRFGKRRPKATIVTRFRIHKRYAAVAQRYPRLSVEYWGKKKDPSNGFFDPICLLGAETPELDLGMWPLDNEDRLTRYQASTHRGMTCRRYQMTSPAGANTAPPADINDEEKHDYQKGTGTMTPEDIAQIVAAFTPVLDAKLEERDARMMAAIDEKLSSAGLSADDDADLSDEAPMGDAAGGDEVPPVDGAVSADADPDAGAESAVAPEQPAAVPESPAAPAADATPEPDGDEKKKFQADPSQGRGDENDGDRLIRYQRERDDYRTRYQKLVTENRDLADRNQALETELVTLRGSSAKQTRYQKLARRQAEGFVFDIDEELADCEALTDEQFSRHVDERIPRRYQRIPMGSLPMDKPEVRTTSSGREDDDPEVRKRYSKLASERYREAEKRGEKPDYNALVKESRADILAGRA